MLESRMAVKGGLVPSLVSDSKQQDIGILSSRPCNSHKAILRAVALSLDEREKPGFSSPGGEHLPGLGLTSVAKHCTVTEKPGFYPTLLQPCMGEIEQLTDYGHLYIIEAHGVTWSMSCAPLPHRFAAVRAEGGRSSVPGQAHSSPEPPHTVCLS